MSDDRTPPRRMLLAEAAALLRRGLGGGACRRLAAAHRGDGRAVLVLPGFLSSDFLTRRLRRTLDAAGYRALGWGGGINRGATAAVLTRLEALLARAAAESGRPVVVIGWSLGGLYARELARRQPALVDRVITLGTPFSGDLRANHAWRLYERVNGYPVDQPPFPIRHSDKPPVPTYALWSPRDGIVAPSSSRGLPHEADRAITVDCRHTAFVSAPAAIAAILDVMED